MTWKHFDGIDDAELYHQIQLYSLHGQSKDALNKNKPGMWEYDIVGTWYKCNMTDVVAAIGLKQFERYPGMLARRKEIIQKYDNAFKPLGVESLPHYTDEHISSGHLYIARIPNCDDQKRRNIIIKLAEEGISTNVHYKPLPMHTAYKKLGFDIKDYPNAYARYANEITLPLHTCLTDEEVEYIIETVTKVLKEYAD
jgi:dTDP-4-amino-4,6-dideoxygalactose transaminase